MTAKPTTNDNESDYTAEGNDPGDSKPADSTDRGYDEAAHKGENGYGVTEGNGGVLGTTSGGTFGGGMQIVERPLDDEDDETK